MTSEGRWVQRNIFRGDVSKSVEVVMTASCEEGATPNDALGKNHFITIYKS